MGPGVQHSASLYLYNGIRLDVSVKALGNIEEIKVSVCCNIEDQNNAVLKARRDLQTYCIALNFPPSTHDDSLGSLN